MRRPKITLVNLPPAIANSRFKLTEDKRINSDSRIGLEHLGLLYLRELLNKADFEAETHDFLADYYSDQIRDRNSYLKQTLSSSPSIVGFSPYFTSIENTLLLAKEIKGLAPEVKVVLGGSHASHTANEILADNPQIDAIFLGEAFRSIIPGIEAISQGGKLEGIEGIAFRNENGIMNTGWGRKVDLDSLPFPARQKGYLRTASMLFSIGCPVACTFCSAEGLRDHGWRSRSVDNLIQEVDLLVQKYKINTIETHSDDAFGSGTKAIPFYERFAKLLISRKYNLKWRSSLRATDFREGGLLLQEDFWKLMQESGLERAYIGFEAGTDERLRKLRKAARVEDNKRAFSLLQRLGVAVHYGFINFFPDSTTEEIGENLRFLHSLGNSNYRRISSNLVLQPGSEYFNDFKERGLLKKPFYLPQNYKFDSLSVDKLNQSYKRFDLDQWPIDILCLDLDYAKVWNQDEITHLGAHLKVKKGFLEERAEDLFRTSEQALGNPDSSGGILAEFNSRWLNKYRRYAKND